MRARAPRKPPTAQNGTGTAELRRHADLMREMDSPDGAWNPEPDGHITGALRDDVSLAPNESKALALIKDCCIRRKDAGRTAWGFLNGKPLTTALLAAYFGWDPNNAQKHLRRLLAWGFVRKNDDGQLGIGARVDGVFTEGRIESEDENQWVCTYPLPEYLAVAAKGLSENEQKNFIQGWVTRKEAAAKLLAEAKRKLWQKEQDELAAHCRAFGLELKRHKPKDKPKPAEEATAEPTNGFVHTHTDGSVHTQKTTLYTAENGYVRTPTNKEAEDEAELASCPDEKREKNPTPNFPDNELTQAIQESIARSKLTKVGAKPLDPRTIANIWSQLTRLQHPREVKEVLEIMEEKCRFLSRHPNEASSKTWGWVYGIVKGEVTNRVGDPIAEIDRIKAELRTMAAKAGMR